MRLPPGVAISDLRDRPEFADTVADRIWRAWWKGRGFSLGYLRELVAESCEDSSIPFVLVAHEGPQFAGTASVIPSDLDERPTLAPWIAAVWVDPDFRERGVGAALVEAAAKATFALGITRVHLCALPARAGFYAKRGWIEIEREVGQHKLTVFVREK